MTIISALPNTISNGQPADAVPLMADLNHIVNQVNANAQQAGLAALLAAANSFTQVQSGVAATSPANFPIASQVQNVVFNTLTSTLGTNTITARVAALAISAYSDGQIFTFQPTQTNSGPATLNVNGVGAASIMSMGTALRGSELSTTVPAMVRYRSPNMHLINPSKGLAFNWTPVATFATPGDLNVVYNTQIGTGMIADGKCTAWYSIITSTWAFVTGTGQFQITGLPTFATPHPGKIQTYRGSTQSFQGITKANYTQITPHIFAGLNEIGLRASGSGQSVAIIMSSDMPSGGTLNLIGAVEFEV